MERLETQITIYSVEFYLFLFDSTSVYSIHDTLQVSNDSFHISDS